MQHPIPPQITPHQPMQQMHATAATATIGGKAASGDHGFISTKKQAKISPVILIAGGIVFLLVYTLFWLKFFNVNLPIPFLGQ